MSREILTAAARIAWSIETSGKTLVELGETIGCTHATLSLWQHGKTPIEKIQVGLLMHFADATNTELRWLLYGEEPRRPTEPDPGAISRLHRALRVMQERAPWKVEPVVSMVEAAANSHRRLVELLRHNGPCDCFASGPLYEHTESAGWQNFTLGSRFSVSTLA